MLAKIKSASPKYVQFWLLRVYSSGFTHNFQNIYVLAVVRSLSVWKYLPIHKLAWHDDTDVKLSAVSSEVLPCARTPAAWLVISL